MLQAGIECGDRRPEVEGTRRDQVPVPTDPFCLPFPPAVLSYFELWGFMGVWRSKELLCWLGCAAWIDDSGTIGFTFLLCMLTISA